MRRPVRPDTSLALAEGTVWLLLLLVPLVFDRHADESFRLPKLLAAEWLGLLSLVFLAWRLRRVGPAEPAGLWQLLWHRPAVRGVLPVVAVATLGLATTAHPLQVRGALADLWIGAACLIGWSVGLPRERLERLVAGLLWPGAVLAFLAVLQFHGLWTWDVLRFAGDERLGLTSLAGNPGDLAAFLVLPCLAGQWRLARSLRWARRAAVAAALALCLYALALTQTLAALAALAAASLVFWALRLPARRVLAGLAAGALLAAVLLAVVAPLRERVAAKASQLRAGDWNELLTGRLDGWRAAAWMFAERPLAGVGQGAYRPEFAGAKLALVAQGVPFYARQITPVFANAHNDFLEAAAEWGIPGLLALVWAVWVLVSSLRRGGLEDRGDAAFAWAGVAGLAVLSLAYFPFHVALVAFPALLFLAWAFRAGGEAA